MILRRMLPKEVRAMIINHTGKDPGDLDPANIKPLSEKAKQHPFFKILPKSNLHKEST